MNGASDKLPRLVADLVLATSEVPDAIRFLSDGAGRVRGFDGVLLSRGSPPHVPAGKSYWEFGCEQDVAAKARRDVRGRTASVPDPAERAQATLVLVTPWHYDNPRKLLGQFVAELAQGRGWKEIRLYDGAVLRHWMAMAPAVAARWARLEMLAKPRDVLSLDEFWQEYSCRFERPLREEVLLAGRGRQADELLLRLGKLTPDRLPLVADSAAEATAFAAAAIRKADPAVRLVLEARTVVVTTVEAARDLRDRSLVFLPSGAALEAAGLLAQWGPTVLPLGRREATPGVMRLARTSRHEFAQALEAMSIPRPRAVQLASECGRSVTVLARRLPAAGVVRPSWSGTSVLVPALLAGGWDSANEHDRAVLAALAGATDYDTWQATMQPHLAEDDPVLEHEGTVWKVRAPVDAFVVLGVHVGGMDFSRLLAATREVYADRDANAGKTGVELVTAGRGLRHSDWLRVGLATTVLLTATLSGVAGIEPALAPSGGSGRWVDEAVRGVPGLASDAALLAALAEALPLLAEAAPLPFVEILDGLLRTAPDTVASLFVERVRFISPESDHVWLLWALEAVAWDGAFLTQVCLLLARLAALDAGGRLMNRPSRTLRNILLAWVPQTNASLNARLGALRAVTRREGKIGWELALSLLPEHHGMSDMTRHPVMREAGRYDEEVPGEEVAAMYGAAAAEVMRLAGQDPERWSTLIDRMSDLSQADQAEVTERLAAMLAMLPEERREPLWRKVRDLVARHSGLPGADWTIKGEPLAALDRLVKRWEPQDAMAKAVLLFGDAGFVYGTVTGSPEGQREREEAGEAALRHVLREHGPAGVLKVAQATRSGWAVGARIARMLGAGPCVALCLEALERETPELAEFVTAVSGCRASLDLEEWTGLVEGGVRSGWGPGTVVTLLLGFPDGARTWDFVRDLPSDVGEEYWRRKPPWRIEDGDGPLLERAVRGFLSVGRAGAALAVSDGAQALPPALAFEILDGTVSEFKEKGADGGSMTSYFVERAFDGLRARADVDRKQLALREYVWLPLLAGPGRPRDDLAIFDLMANDPTDFVAFLAVVFRSSSAPDAPVRQVDPMHWRAAYNVLEAFRKVPGEADGEIDGHKLSAWVAEAIRQAGSVGLEDLGAQHVGKVLAHAPPDKGDGAWPAAPLRDLIDRLELDHLERGISTERFNMRGVHLKGVYEGGSQERELAGKNRAWAEACGAWPRTAAMLARIAEDWERQAEREDSDARQRLMRD